MPFKKGQKKAGGRAKGTINKSKKAILDKAKKKGITPLDYLLEVLNNKKTDERTRIEAAKAASPYIHRKMPQSIENTDMNKLADKSDKELEDMLRGVEKRCEDSKTL